VVLFSLNGNGTFGIADVDCVVELWNLAVNCRDDKPVRLVRTYASVFTLFEGDPGERESAGRFLRGDGGDGNRGEDAVGRFL